LRAPPRARHQMAWEFGALRVRAIQYTSSTPVSRFQLSHACTSEFVSWRRALVNSDNDADEEGTVMQIPLFRGQWVIFISNWCKAHFGRNVCVPWGIPWYNLVAFPSRSSSQD
jgi:hypothetical protein